MSSATRLERRHATVGRSGAERTLRAMVATVLGILPLNELFTDVRWIFDTAAAVVVVAGTAAVLRYWSRPRVWHIWLGVLVLVPWLTWRFVPHHAFGGFILTRASFTDISHLLDRVRQTTNDGVAPVPTDRAVTLVLAAVAGLLAVFIDLVAVVGRRPALAGVPLLVVFTVAGAVTRHAVSWFLFGATAVAFLLLLSVDARDEVRDWGRLIPRAGEARPTAALGVSGPRIAVVAIAVSLFIPLLVPTRGSNLLANALHNGRAGGTGTSIGAGGVSLDPFAALKGELQRSKPVNLLTVTVSPNVPTPFYLRANVLSVYTGTGWRADTHGARQNVSATSFATDPAAGPLSAVAFTARITINGLSDNPPVFALPVGVAGVPGATTWSLGDQLLLDSTVGNGGHISEQVSQPDPSIADLTASGSDYPASLQPDLLVPPTMPASVGALVAQLTQGKASQYAKARALSDFFTSPASGFAYSLQTKVGDSGSQLVDFLTNRSGFCQQFAAAMGIMLRIAGIPSRVVLGYTHAPPDSSGTFTVTSNNAHAWVEAYFTGLGWIPFDPTPISSVPGAATSNLVWAPHPTGSTNPNDVLPSPAATGAGQNRAPGPAAAGNGPSSASGASHFSWPLIGFLVGLFAIAVAAAAPASIRRSRRRLRLRAARRGDPDPLWAELSDTATDLGYVWSSARSPRQVVDWLAADVGRVSAGSLRSLATAVELARYSGRPGVGAAPLVPELREVEARLRAHRSRSTRIKSRLLPASLGWPRLTRRRNRRRP